MTKLYTSLKSFRFIYIALAFLINAIPAQAQNTDFDDLSLNGFSTFEQLRKEYFIGGLYLNSITQNAEDIIQLSGNKRMDIRVTIDKWSPRSFARQWNQLILINNDQKLLNEFSDQILSFIELPKKDLIAGDIIRIDNDPKDGTSIYLNGIRFFNESNNKFFDVLLNAWIGQRPPSSSFKNNILVMPSDTKGTDMLVRYEATTPSQARTKIVASWIKPKPSKISRAKKQDTLSSSIAPPVSNSSVTARRESTSSNSDLSITKKPSVATVAAVVAAPKVQFDTPQIKNGNKSSNTQKPSEVKTTPSKPAAPVMVKAEAATNIPTKTQEQVTVSADPKTTPIADAKAIANNKLVAKPVADTEMVATVEVINDATVAKTTVTKTSPKVIATPPDVNQARLVKVFRSKILRMTYKNTLYPKRALKYSQEGEVSLKVSLDRSGKVLNIVEEKSSKHKLLNKAARKAVAKTAPYPSIPDEIKGDILDFILPFKFKL